jgi:hypothetical protein
MTLSLPAPGKSRALPLFAALLLLPAARADEAAAGFAGAWTVAEQRCAETVGSMAAAYGEPGMYGHWPTHGNTTTGRWTVTNNSGQWRSGFWPGTLWLIAQRTGDPQWLQRANAWTVPLATTTNNDHDIGFITLSSLGKGWYFHDDLSDPGGVWREFARQALTAAAGRLDARFNKPNGSGEAVPAGMIRSWDTIEGDYPVCIDNLMNLELLLLAYEMNGRLPEQRPWFDHALEHARNSIARHFRADGGTYHVVRHFQSGPRIGEVQAKKTRQGYGDETTWSRGQAWAIHGLTTVYRHARRDPATDASDLLAAAQRAADYFIARLPHHFTADPYNHRIGDFVPPVDFDAALGEPDGPWNDANDNYNPSSGGGLGDAEPATEAFSQRDSSAAAIAASGLVELSGVAATAADRARYLAAAEDILDCLVSYDGPDGGSAPDYRCLPGETANPGILKLASNEWDSDSRSLIYGDFYFLEALARLEARRARERIAASQRLGRVAGGFELEFEIPSPAPALSVRVEWSDDLVDWTPVAARTGCGPWSGPAAVATTNLDDCQRVKVGIPAAGASRFLRVTTRATDASAP